MQLRHSFKNCNLLYRNDFETASFFFLIFHRDEKMDTGHTESAINEPFLFFLFFYLTDFFIKAIMKNLYKQRMVRWL